MGFHMTANSLDDRIQAARQKAKEAEELAKQLEARKALAEARKLVGTVKGARSEDIRRKILLGAFMLERLEASGTDALGLVIDDVAFGAWLTRKRDRELFEPVSTSNEPAKA